jgi:hypothetical protein
MLSASTHPSSSSFSSCSDPDVCIANGTYLSTGVFHEWKKSIGSCVPTKSRANARRFSTSRWCSSGKSRARFSTLSKNCSRLMILAHSWITWSSWSRLSLMDSATRRRSSSCLHLFCCASHSCRRISASRSASFTLSTRASVELSIDFTISWMSFVRALASVS